MFPPVIPEAETQSKLSGICGGFTRMREVPDSLGFRDDG
jgi:hypothetical protein